MSNAIHIVFMALVVALALSAFSAVFDSRKQPAVPARVVEPANSTPTIGVRRAARPEMAGRTSKVRPLVAPKAARSATPVSSNYAIVDLAGAANANFLADIKRSSRGPEGLPEDGRVPIPGLVPRAFFHLGETDTNNAIVLKQMSLELPPKQRVQYQQIAVLHGAPISGGLATMTLHYASGEDQKFQLNVLSWNPRNRREKPVPQQFTAVQTLGADGRINAELFSQTFEIDEMRVFESIAMEFTSDAAVFAVSLILAE